LTAQSTLVVPAEQRALNTNAEKQLSSAATDIKLTLVLQGSNEKHLNID